MPSTDKLLPNRTKLEAKTKLEISNDMDTPVLTPNSSTKPTPEVEIDDPRRANLLIEILLQSKRAPTAEAWVSKNTGPPTDKHYKRERLPQRKRLYLLILSVHYCRQITPSIAVDWSTDSEASKTDVPITDKL